MSVRDKRAASFGGRMGPHRVEELVRHTVAATVQGSAKARA
jgi:hypothetical protein